MTPSTESPAVNKSSLWKNVLLSVFVVVVTFGAVEIAARLLVWVKFGDSRRGMTWDLRYEPYLIHTDANAPPFITRYPDKAGKFRVVLIGGSTMEQMDSMMVRDLVHSTLQRDVDVINLARGGFISNQERVALVLYGIRLNPDLLISLDGANDIVMMTKSSKVGIPYLNEAVAFSVDHPFLNAFASTLRHSQFFNVLLKLKERKIERSAQGDEDLKRRAIQNYQESVAAIAVVAKGLGVPYLMVLQPYIHLRNGLTARERSLPDMKNYAYRKEFMTTMFHRLDSAMAGSALASTTYINGNGAFDESSGEVFEDEVHLTANGERRLMQYVLGAGRGVLAGADSATRAAGSPRPNR